MNEVAIFNNPDFGQVRTLKIKGEPWFVGKDVAAALEYDRPDKAIGKHVDQEDKLMERIGTLGQKRQMYVINESGLYSLIFSSKMDKAKEFKRWVTSEVLPAIRKTGMYAENLPTVKTRPLTTDDYILAAGIVAKSPKAHLPYVLNLLDTAGFDASEPLDRYTCVNVNMRHLRDNEKRAKMYIKAAQRRGVSCEKIGELTGIHKNQIWRYSTGQYTPTVERMEMIVEAIRELIPNIDDYVD